MTESIAFEAGKIYHFYNRSNNRERIFLEEENYFYFLSLYKKYLDDLVKTQAYCLLPNHFHFLIAVVAEEKVGARNLVSQAFSNCFNAYAKAFNKRYQRSGSLFQPHPKRKEIRNTDYYTAVIHYIHSNPVHHGLCSTPSEWKYSSYQAFLSDRPTRLAREEVLAWYGGKDQFIALHQAGCWDTSRFSEEQARELRSILEED